MDNTRDRILGLAVASFAAKGYNAVGVQELCVAAAVTKPTLYYHFGSKRGLLDAVASERYDNFVHAVGASLAYHGDVAASLLEALGVFLKSAREDADFSRLRLGLAFSPPESQEHAAFRNCTERLYSSFREFFVAAAKDHGNMKGRDLAYAASFVGTADAYVGLLLAGTLNPDKAFMRRVVHHFMHGIFS